jgi:hypothetical protein
MRRNPSRLPAKRELQHEPIDKYELWPNYSRRLLKPKTYLICPGCIFLLSFPPLVALLLIRLTPAAVKQ